MQKRTSNAISSSSSSRRKHIPDGEDGTTATGNSSLDDFT